MPDRCQACESPCHYGMELLDVLGMEKPPRPENCREAYGRDRRIRRIIRGMNKSIKR